MAARDLHSQTAAPPHTTSHRATPSAASSGPAGSDAHGTAGLPRPASAVSLGAGARRGSADSTSSGPALYAWAFNLCHEAFRQLAVKGEPPCALPSSPPHDHPRLPPPRPALLQGASTTRTWRTA
jgi:hypothetical protein